jgi:uncharacterized protein (TIGR03067 family)
MKCLRLWAVVVSTLLIASAGIAEDKKTFDRDKLVGKWQLTGGKKAGADVGEELKKGVYIFTKDQISIKLGDMTLFEINYKLDPKASPVAIDMEITKSPDAVVAGAKAKGIIEVSGDEMKLCYFEGDRPTKFDGSAKYHYFTLKRIKDDKDK